MKRLLSSLAVVAAALLIGGCNTPSLNPLASDDKVVEDAGLVGTWIPQEDNGKPNTDEKYNVTAQDDKAYQVTIVRVDEKEKKPQEFGVKLVQLGSDRYIDLTIPKSAKKELEPYGTTVAPMHNIIKMKRDGDTLTIWPMTDDAVGKALKDGTLKIPYAKYGEDEDPVLTATTKELQAFLGGKDAAKYFKDPSTMKREAAK
jgi:hypothetical protein